MIAVKSEEEIALLRESCRIVKECLEFVGSRIRAGMTTKEVDELVYNFIKASGAEPSCLGYCGYPASACVSVNETVVHGIPDDETVLREGDKIIIPQYTNTVKINGAVMHPTTISYLDNKKLKSYVDRAGGYAYRANKKRAYVIYMNGTIDRLKSRSRKAVQPGCEIIIPYKQARGNFGVAEIVSLSSASASLATMAATLVGLFGK